MLVSGTLYVEECFWFSHGRVSGCVETSVPERLVPKEERNGLYPVKAGPEVSECKFRDAGKLAAV